MRLFIALPLPPDVLRALKCAQNKLRTLNVPARYVPPENFHITLHFIGESGRLSEAAACVDEAVRGIRPFLLRLKSFSSFSRGSRHIAYMDLSGDLKELYTLHETLLSALLNHGFDTGKKRLTPHITLARDAELRDANDIAGLSMDGEMKAAFTANQLVLYESVHAKGGMVYTPLRRAMFQ